MKAIVIVFMLFRNRLVPGQLQIGNHATPPFWTWFIENPREG